MIDWKPFEGWSDLPVDVPLLVHLQEKELFNHVHSAIRIDNASRTAMVGGYFYYDMPTPTHWAEVPNLPEGV